jgi:acyl carrier protein
MTTQPQQTIVELLREVTGEDEEWAAGVGPRTRLDGDLFLDSLELLALSGRLAERYGPGVDLAGFVGGLALERLLTLTVAEVADYVSARL